MDARSPLPDAHFLARGLRGEVRRSSKTGDLYVVAPGPGHSPKDRSMTVFLGSQFPDGFWVTSHAGDDELACRDYVNNVLGRPAWKPADKTDDIIGRMGAKARSSTGNTAKEQQEAPKKDQSRSRTRFNDAYLLRAGYQQVAIYPYEVGDELLYQVLRYEHPTEGKRFLQRSPDGQDGWWGDAGDRKVLYRVNDLQKVAHDTAFVTEGEKDADRLASLDFVAVTVASGNWSEEALRALAGYECLILEDNDDPGRKRAQKAAAALHGIARCVRIVSLPGLPEKGDVSDWLDDGNDHNRLIDIATSAPLWTPEAQAQDGVQAIPLSLTEWELRDLAEPDFLMGDIITTTSRVLLVAPTGLGKTNFAMALGGSIAAGRDFLHWQAKRPARVLYIDGEMSARLLKARLADMVRRLGVTPETFFALSREDILEFAPLNTPEGRAQIEAVILRIGGVEFIVFDNIMSLLVGDMKDEESWQQVLPWVRDLTRRGIGQLWIHHTGHDESRSYGTKTREWQLDTVMHMSRVERADTDVSFSLSFRKARERTPDNRADFQDVKIALVSDRWEHKVAQTSSKGRISPTARKFLDALVNVLAGGGVTTFQGWKAATTRMWQSECVVLGLIDPSAKPDSARALFSKNRRDLVAAKYVACNGDLTWLL